MKAGTLTFLSTLLSVLCALTAQAQTLTELRWLTEDFPPYNYATEAGADGLMVDVLQTISESMQQPVNPADIQVLPWTRAVHTAQNDGHSVLFSLARTDDREAQYQWAGPVVPIRIVMMGLPEAQQRPPESWRIGVVRDDVAVRLVTAAGYQPEQLVYSAYPASVARMLLAGRVDVWAYGELPAQQRLDALPGQEDWQVLEVLSSTQAYFGFHPDVDPMLVEQFRNNLNQLTEPDAQGRAPMDALIERYTRSY
ncbi:substrate-binding periplasmic protein [Saccharospirillum mangrovi]|uniref:substrate-binding periplasmic protein n=1 Tax=Saccharospirillum mangrovi TaxID=2161747 RepID=UPI000D3BB677|nr:transporter substrate-binding domain-containing protein [Saccharospirillum mangrovi]